MSENQTVATALPSGMLIVCLKKYVVTANTPFEVQCVYPDGSPAEVMNTVMSNRGKNYMISFDAPSNTSLLINGNEVEL